MLFRCLHAYEKDTLQSYMHLNYEITCQNLHDFMYEQQSLRSACTGMQADLGLCSSQLELPGICKGLLCRVNTGHPVHLLRLIRVSTVVQDINFATERLIYDGN